MKSNSLKVALVISTYNAEVPLRKCLEAVLRQRRMPDEVVIADDGSRQPTRDIIADFAARSPVPVKHIWHPDKGFRKCLIMNKAIAATTSPYIIQIDGDVVPTRNFVKDHLRIARPGYFVCGSRAKLTERGTRSFLSSKRVWPLPCEVHSGSVFNALRLPWLSRWFSTRYDSKRVDHLRGCNMAYGRQDFIDVNGYDENLTDWGHEDGELAFRLHFNGVGKLMLKFSGAVYHTWHKKSSRHNEHTHSEAIKKVVEGKLRRCDNGIDKHLDNTDIQIM